MENRLKFYLLAEESGWDCSAYAFKDGPKIRDSGSYRVLSYNVIEARKHLSSKAQAIAKAYDNLRFEPKTLEEAFIIENTVNYLALNSFPEYYLNPLAIDPNYAGEVTTLGDLIFDYRGKEKTLNEIILDEGETPEVKKEEVNRKLDYYLTDMNRIVSASLLVIEGKTADEKSFRKATVAVVFEIIGFVLLHFLLAFLFLYPSETFRFYLFHPDPSRFLTYIGFLYPALLFFYDLSAVTFHSYQAKISEPYNYARRFLRRNAGKVFEDIKDGKERLSDYIAGAINSRIVLKNDIRDFSKLSSSYVDFKAVLNVSSLKEKRLYRFLSALDATAMTLAGIMGFVSLIVYILSIAFATAI
jgi:hypothetical protein